jgi:serine/threonine protein kinase
VLYEMATGKPPFQGATPAVVFEGILNGIPPAPSQMVAGVPEDLDRIIFRALEKDREMRYQSAADLRADLRRLRKATESGRTQMMGSVTPRTPTTVPDVPAQPAARDASAPSVSSAAPSMSAAPSVSASSRRTSMWWIAAPSSPSASSVPW